MDYQEVMVIMSHIVKIEKIMYGMNLMILLVIYVIKKIFIEEVLIYYYMKEYFRNIF